MRKQKKLRKSFYLEMVMRRNFKSNVKFNYSDVSIMRSDKDIPMYFIPSLLGPSTPQFLSEK